MAAAAAGDLGADAMAAELKSGAKPLQVQRQALSAGLLTIEGCFSRISQEGDAKLGPTSASSTQMCIWMMMEQCSSCPPLTTWRWRLPPQRLLLRCSLPRAWLVWKKRRRRTTAAERWGGMQKKLKKISGSSLPVGARTGGR